MILLLQIALDSNSNIKPEYCHIYHPSDNEDRSLSDEVNKWLEKDLAHKAFLIDFNIDETLHVVPKFLSSLFVFQRILQDDKYQKTFAAHYSGKENFLFFWKSLKEHFKENHNVLQNPQNLRLGNREINVPNYSPTRIKLENNKRNIDPEVGEFSQALKRLNIPT